MWIEYVRFNFNNNKFWNILQRRTIDIFYSTTQRAHFANLHIKVGITSIVCNMISHIWDENDIKSQASRTTYYLFLNIFSLKRVYKYILWELFCSWEFFFCVFDDDDGARIKKLSRLWISTFFFCNSRDWKLKWIELKCA